MAAILSMQEVREIEAALHVEILPGTEVMTQVNDIHFVEGSHHQVLVPQPSNFPEDPLNWSPFWKGITMASMVMVAFVQAFGPMAIAPSVPYYMAEWDRSLADVLQFAGICILVLGFSNFIWVPISTTFGRRPALLLSLTVSLCACIWRSKASSYSSFLGACILHGIGAGTAETLPPVFIADVMFLHERGFWNSMYTNAYFGSLMVGPIIAGAMTDAVGWRSFWWLNVAMYGFVLLFVLLLHPETYYDRRQLVVSDTRSQSFDSERTYVPEKAEPGSEENAEPGSVEEAEISVTIDQAHNHVDKYLRKGRPILSQLIKITMCGTTKQILHSLITPIKLFCFPIVQWTAFAFSWSSALFLMVSMTQSQVFAAPPYNKSAAAVGHTNWALLLGSIIGMATAGPLSDWISMKMTKTNNGIREPEMRLVSLIPFTIASSIGTLVVAYGYQYKWRFELIVWLGYTLLGVQCTSISAIAITYSIDSYKPVAGEILVSVTVNKNLWGYGVSTFLIPWVVKSGFVAPLWVLGATGFVVHLAAIPLYFYGKRLRRSTKDSFVHKM